MSGRADFSILILAGGEGRRIGGGKPLRMIGGRTLIARAIERAQSWSDEVQVSARCEDQVGASGIDVLPDPPGFEGPLGGLAAAAGLAHPAVLTIPCDMPFLPDDLPERLAAALPGHGAALAASGGHVHPVCGLWRTESLSQVGDYAASGRRSLIGFAERIGFAAVEWPDDLFLNINDPEDLAKAEARLLQ